MEHLLSDIRYGFRSLLKHPGFTAVAVITLALGIGANSAMFSTVNSVLLQPLPYPESNRIVVLEGINPPAGITQSNMSVPDLADWQAQNQVFDKLAGFVSGGALLANADETERVRAASVSADFFSIFRTPPLHGRALAPYDSEKGHERVVVLSFGLWRRRFGGDPNIVGRKVTITGEPITVVGVMPASFDYPQQSELWLSFPLNAASERRDNRYVNVVARLQPGVGVAQAQTEMNTISQRLAQSYTVTNTGWSVRVTNLQERLVKEIRSSLLVLLGAVAFVLLIACANVANLLVARSTGRQREIAVRAALGASRWRVVRQLLTESLLLSFIGGAMGLMLSVWLTKLLVAISPANTPRFDEIRPDARVLLFTLGVTILTGIIFGLAPALHASRTDLNTSLKDGARSGSAGAHNKRLRSVMMVSEIALSFMLLVGAGLLIKSFLRLREVSPGFNPSNVLTLRINLVLPKNSQGPTRSQLLSQTLERLKALPDVTATGAVLSLPLSGDTFNVGRSLVREGRPLVPEESENAAYLPTTPGYFQTLQIPLSEGRVFNEQDNDTATKVVIVNQTLARRLWPGQSPLGKHITIWRDEKFAREIVGVVGDTKAALEDEAETQMYVPFAQDSGWGAMSLMVRTNGDPQRIATAARAAIHAVDKGIPISNVRSMDEVLAKSVAQRRTSMLLLSAFAGVALLLAMIGIYGVTAYYVTQRTQEIGIRIALGARVGDVMRLVLQSGMFLAICGVGCGLAGAFTITRLLASLLFGVTPTDVFTFAGVSLCLLLTALVACYLPARRASRIDPLVALRYE
ncbi:MAG TPA: ABC transporter permease [Pyrinomonadaceae bacterium]|nr:ABC transporter permease [Pyrinomonadaceae bacterium]